MQLDLSLAELELLEEHLEDQEAILGDGGWRSDDDDLLVKIQNAVREEAQREGV